MTQQSSRWWHFMLMLPFFLIGVALPVYFYGFSGDGPPNLQPDRYSPVPVTLAPPNDTTPNPGGGFSPPDEAASPYARHSGQLGLVGFVRGLFDGFVDSYVSPSFSPAAIKLSVFAGLFLLVFLVIRVGLALITGVFSNFMLFLIHKAAAPMFMGFLAVGSTWGIHQTVADQFGMSWAATSVTLTAAVASLFALAGVRIR